MAGLFFLSPNYPWYFLAVVPFIALGRRRAGLGHDAGGAPALPADLPAPQRRDLENARHPAVRHRRGLGACGCAGARSAAKTRSIAMDELTIEPADGNAVDARRYFEAGARSERGVANKPPVCLYLEVTNRCNLLCTTCPRTYAELEPPADMSWELFTRIVDQVPNLSRAVLHGVGEPMLVKNLPQMVRYLKDRGAYVLFNTNGTVLNEKNGRALIAGRPRRAARVARCVDAGILHQGARQGLFPAHPAQREGVPRHAGSRRPRQAARVGLADRPQGDDRRAAGFRAGGRRDRRQGSLPAAPGVLRSRHRRPGAARPGAVRAHGRQRGAGAGRARKRSPNRWA